MNVLFQVIIHGFPQCFSGIDFADLDGIAIMMRTYLFLSFFCAVVCHGQQFNFSWANIFYGSMYPMNIVADSNSNIICNGTYAGIVDFDPGPGIDTLTGLGAKNQFLAKYKRSGELMWAKKLHLAILSTKSLCLDKNGNIYILGTFSGIVDVDPGPAEFLLESKTTSFDIYVCKLNQNGDFLWAKQLGASGSDYGKSICKDSQDNIVIVGSFEKADELPVDLDPGPSYISSTLTGFDDAFVIKLTGNGDYLWGHVFGAIYGDQFTSIATDSSNNIIIGGLFSGPLDIDPGPAVQLLNPATNSSKGLIVKLSSSGNLHWAKCLQGTAASGCSSVKILKFIYFCRHMSS